MKISELQPRQGKVDIEIEVVNVDEPREFNKFGKTGKVANATAKDETGQIKLTLWNEDIDKVKPGAKVKITNGYVNEWQGEMQLTTGKFGQMEVLEEGSAPAEASPEAPAQPAPAQEQAPTEKPDENIEIDEDIL